jgi:hypothetical protein
MQGVEGPIVVTREAEEAKDAFNAYNRVRNVIRSGAPTLTKEQLVRKRAKEKKAKRKRGGPR